MPANTAPIYGLTPNTGTCVISTSAANVASDGSGNTGTTMFTAFTAGANGSYVQKVRFMSAASTPTTGVATVLRVYLSSVTTQGTATTKFNTTLLGELSVPAVPSANASNGTNWYELPLNMPISTGEVILVSQHAAQTTNQNWQCLVIGMDY